MSILITESNGLPVCVDTDTIQENNLLIQIAIALSNAGYSEGIKISEAKLKNGRYLQMVQADLSTPEGIYIEMLGYISPQPTEVQAIEAVRNVYERCANGT